MHNKKLLLLSVCLIITHIMTAEVPNFEIWNKTQQAIQLVIQFTGQGGHRLSSSSTVHPDGNVNVVANFTKQPVLITINNSLRYRLDPSCKKSGDQVSCYYQTAYLSFEDANLRPQKGTWLGLLGTTHRGYDNSKNINQHYIIREQ